MKRFDEVAALAGVDRVTLAAWIERGWVRPSRKKDRYLFDEADVARVRLIVEMRGELSIEEETLPVVLSLLDQLYAARRALTRVCEAVRDLPKPLRREIRDRLRADGA